ncbi:MAG TPA: hypothetical protein VF659_09375 [Pyrinomonadaceae bacterium]
MISKSSKKRAPKLRIATLVQAENSRVSIATLVNKRPVRNSNTPVGHRRIPCLPNPFPTDIQSLIETAILVSGLAPFAFKVIALWVEDRKARKVRVVIGEHEIRIETEGQPSWKEIERICKEARKLAKGKDANDLKVILPRGVDPSIPVEMLREVSRKKDTPKAKAEASTKVGKKGGKGA